MKNELEHHYVQTKSVRLHVVTAGPADGPVVVLLHGFPEFWFSWRKQIAPLAEAGYRVIVPDQRGYNLSDKPWRVSAYGLDSLTLDAVRLIEWTGCERAFVVGHDRGAAVACLDGRAEIIEEGTHWVQHEFAERVNRLLLDFLR